MAEGRSNVGDRGALVVTERAVEKHVTSIFEKLRLAATRTTTGACSPCSPSCARSREPRAVDHQAGSPTQRGTPHPLRATVPESSSSLPISSLAHAAVWRRSQVAHLDTPADSIPARLRQPHDSAYVNERNRQPGDRLPHPAPVAPVPALRSLRRSFKGALIEPAPGQLGCCPPAFDLAVRQEPALVAVPADEPTSISIVESRPGTASRWRPAHRSQRRAARRLSDVSSSRPTRCTGSRSTSSGGSPACGRHRSGGRVPPASELGLAALHGSTPDVSVVGYSLGGGVGWYARKHGLSANSVTAIELVTADGGLRRVDADNDADLFWALRGGGGNFGIVTALEIQLYPVPEVYAGVLFFPWERVLRGAARLARMDGDGPRRGHLGRPDPPVPAARGRPGAAARRRASPIVEAVVIGDEAAGAELLAPIRELGPAMDTFAMVPAGHRRAAHGSADA